MFFYIDESGHSGNNLFDDNQPVLSYGVLSCKTNLDLLAAESHAAILRKIDSPSLHANKLGPEGFRPIVRDLAALHRRFRLHFDYYFVDKRSFALVTFFNAVFDAGINEAVKWDWYWTPLRFPVIAALETLADENMLKESWALCLVPQSDVAKEEGRIVQLLGAFLQKLDGSQMDTRLREIIRDALLFGVRNPLQLDFGTYNRKALSPNAIGFQFVITALARRIKATSRKALGILVDQQSEFNPAQLDAYSIQSKKAEGFRNSPADREKYLAHPFLEGVREDVSALISHFPQEKVTISNSNQSIGLQICDAFLWIANRVIKNAEMPHELRPLAHLVFSRGAIDGISVPAMMRRWEAFERKLPKTEDVSPVLKAKSDALVGAHRSRVKGMKLD